MLRISNQYVKLLISKEGEKYFGALQLNGKTLNVESDFDIDISKYENQALECFMDGKDLVYDNHFIKKYDNVFAKDTILDLYVKDGVGTIYFGDYPVESFNCDLNRKHYKVNVNTDEDYTIVRYANLHQHTENSLLDGIARISDLSEKSEYACAITDHGNMYGWYDMLNAFNKKRKKAIIGEEFYIETFKGPRPILPKDLKVQTEEELMFDNSKEQNEEGLNGEHLIVLAKNNQGIKNLFWLSSQASLHFYRKPHITFEELKSHSEGLIVCSACLAGGLSQFVKEYLKAKELPEVREWIDNYGETFYLDPVYRTGTFECDVYAYNHQKAREYIEWFKDVFGDDFYIEYQDHHFPLENLVMNEIVRIRNEEYPEIKIVATCDAHYLNKEDAYVHELWLCNQTKRTIDDPKHMKFSGDGYYVHTSNEMLEQFPVEFLDNTLEIEEKIHYDEINKGYHLPHFPLPEGYTDDNEYFKALVKKTFGEKFKDQQKDKVYKDRLVTEGKTIQSMGWASYFLIVSDFIKWAEDTKVAEHPEEYFPNVPVDEIPKKLLKDYKIYTGSGRGCVCAGTKIVTKDSLVNIEDLKVNDFVRTHTGQLKKIIDTHKYAINEPLYKIRCYGGDDFGNTYTHDHKILVVRDEKEPVWVSAQDIRIGDYVLEPNFVNEEVSGHIDLKRYTRETDKGLSVSNDLILYNNEVKVSRNIRLTNDLMYLLGLMTSSGWITKDSWGIYLENNCENELKLFNNVFGINMTVEKIGSLIQLSSKTVLYNRFFKSFWGRDFSYNSKTKNFPSWILNLSKDLKMAFLRGLQKANEGKNCIISPSYKLIAKAKILLSSMGYVSKLIQESNTWEIQSVQRDDINIIALNGYTGKLVEDIEIIEDEKYVYDITVEDDHSYLTSSFIAHNSGAGSLINACLGITKVDPIKYDLSFERFLNPDRISMPDIDTDFENSLRGEVLEYVRFKYGYDKVANIITFGTCAAKDSVKTINRILGYSVANGDMISKLIPEKPGTKLKDAMATADFSALYNTNPDVKKIVDLAFRIEGLKKSQSIHACATLITDEAVTNYMPKVLMEDPDTKNKIWVTQMEGPTCEELGCLKMDFLGLKTLGYVHETIDSIKENTGIEIDYDTIPLDDMNVYRYLYEGNTSSVFQCESDMFTTVIKKTLKDNETAQGDECFDRLVAMNALVRPGSNVFIDDFADRILNPEKIEYFVPELEPILKTTYGIILYQEQTMRITKDLAGFSAGQADTVRKAMGKKKKYIMDEYRDYFIHGNKKKKIKGCVANGIPEKKAGELWDIMAMAASYSFNKSHAVAYSMHSIRTAWLSYYYPFEYMTGVLNTFSYDASELSKYLGVARKKGMAILAPSINHSKANFTTNEKAIRAGISGVKGINAVAEKIIQEREINGEFESLKNFIDRMSYYDNFSKRTLESLTYAGMLDGWCGSRLNKVNQLTYFADYNKKFKDYRKKLNDGKKHRKLEPPVFEPIIDETEMDMFDLLTKEKEYTGMYISGNPMELFNKYIGKCPDCSSITESHSMVCGIVQKVEKKVSKKGNPFYTFKLENNGIISGILTSKNGTIRENQVVKLEGKISQNEFGINISVNTIEDLTEIRNVCETPKTVYVNLPNPDAVNRFKEIKFKEGTKKIVATYRNKPREFNNVLLDLPTAEEIIEIVGQSNIYVKETPKK